MAFRNRILNNSWLVALTALFAAPLYAQTVVDNLDTEFIGTGIWGSSSWTSGFYGTDYRYAPADDGSKTATWNFALGAVGLYTVEAQWTSHSNRASDAPYTIYNNGVAVATERVDQRINGGQFNLLGNYPLQAGTLDIVLSDTASGVVIADAVRVTYVGPIQNLPPNGTIELPTGDISIEVGGSVFFQGSGSDYEDGSTSLTYLWQFGAGSGIADTNQKDPGLVTFDSPGSYTVTLTVTDTESLADPTPAAVTVDVSSIYDGLETDNADSGFATVGTWGSSSATAGYYGTDYRFALAGNGSKTATWNFALGAVGLYTVEAQWTSHSNRASDAPYTIYNNGVAVATERVDQRINGGQFNLLGNYPLQAGTLDIVLSDTASGVVIADAVRVTYVGPIQNLPPNGTIELPTGDISIEVGGSVFFQGSGSDYEDGSTSLTYLWQFGAGSGIADTNQKDPGLVTFDSPGSYTVTLTVTDTESLADPTPAAVTVDVSSIYDGLETDNADSGFATVGTWGSSSATAGYYGTDYRFALAGNGSKTATWNFALGAVGLYTVEAQWTSRSNRASDAPYTIYNNGVAVATERVDQRINGGQFNLLGNYPLQAGTLDIVLSDTASGVVIADAVRVTYVGPVQDLPPNGTIELPGTDISIAVGDSVFFQGSGSDFEDDSSLLTYLWQFGAGSGIADSNQKDPGLVTFDSPGSYTVTLTVTDADLLDDPTPATVTVDVSYVDSSQIIDNSDGGFSRIGTWKSSSFTPGYYGTNYRYAVAGNGSKTATWSFILDTTDMYTIELQWTAHSNRASDAPYTIYNNGVAVATERVDQRINGGQFNLLDNYPLQAGTLDIVLSDTASGVVIADAVRINTDPIVVIEHPNANDFLVSDSLVVRARAFNFQPGWGVKFVVDGDYGSAVADFIAPFEHEFISLGKGEHSVEAYFVNADGTRQPINSYIVQFGMGDYFVAFGDSITNGIGDDLTFDDVSMDGRTTGRGYAPILADLLSTDRGHPNLVVREGVGGENSNGGRQRITSVISSHPDAQVFLIQYGTNDAGDGISAIEFKANLQGIIDEVIDAGKMPVLAKPPITLSSGTKNSYLTAYGVVIDELVLENGISVVPPDFYSHFESHPEEFVDDIHPNGQGYRSMAQLWFDVLR